MNVKKCTYDGDDVRVCEAHGISCSFCVNCGTAPCRHHLAQIRVCVTLNDPLLNQAFEEYLCNVRAQR